jgi:hypothetical protein
MTAPKIALIVSCARKVAREPGRGVVQRDGRAVQVGRAGETDDAVPQVLPPQEDEDRDDQDDAGGREGWRMGERTPNRARGTPRSPRWRGRGRGRPGRGRAGGSGGEARQALHHAGERAHREVLQVRELALHRRGVAGHVGGEGGELGREEEAEEEDRGEGEQDREDHRGRARGYASAPVGR